MGPGVGKQPRAPPAPIPPGSLHRRGSDAPSHIPQRVPSSPEPRAPILGLGGAVLTPVPFLPLQPTCTSARPCGRAAGCASRPTRASSAAGACRRSAARCGSTAWPPRAAGCTPAAATAAAPTPRSPRYAGTGWEWGQSSPVARQSGRGLPFGPVSEVPPVPPARGWRIRGKPRIWAAPRLVAGASSSSSPLSGSSYGPRSVRLRALMLTCL